MELIWTPGRPPKLSCKKGKFSIFGAAPLLESQQNTLEVIEKDIFNALRENISKIR